ncbi:MAG: hypothetical protein LBN18_07705 [Dysgonamonadaceae bacterium]|jgi:hypothetical protein|nr:hypothetical protein [Dysgonamonadaceae bacterium]
MKAKISMFLLAAAMVILSSCGGKMSPTAYNQKIVSMQSAYDQLNNVMEKFYDNSVTGEEAQKLVDSLATTFDKSNKTLAELQYPDKAAGMHEAAVTLFQYTTDSIIPLFRETLKFEHGTDQWGEVWNKLATDINGRGSELEDALITEQENFAKAANIRLER